jgi:phospholipid-transporting ATPase
LRSAGCKVWLLTGDKTGTAINIGNSSGLLDRKMNDYIIDFKSVPEIMEEFNKIEKEVEKCFN